MENLVKTFKPGLSDQSVKVYVNTINKVIKDLDGKNDLKFLNNHKKVFEYLNNMKVSYLTIRNIENTIIVFMQALNFDKKIIKIYQDKRDLLNLEYVNKSGEKTAKQIKNWATMEEINNVIDELKIKVKNIQKKKEFNKKDLHAVQNLFILMFYTTIPLRNDLNTTKIITLKKYNKLTKEEKESSNYWVYGLKNFLSLSQYKTYSKYGLKIIPTNKEIDKYFYLWYDKFSPNKEYLLIHLPTGEPMTSHQLTLTLTKIFKKALGRNISTSLLRSIICTEKYKVSKAEQDDFAYKMCHSVATQQNIYVKSN